jgi:hypothetical protein
MIPSAWPSASRACSRAIAWMRSVRMERVSRPWIVLASPQRCRPSSVFGPVDLPPCVLQTFFPFRAGARHCCFVRFDLAWQRGQVMRPPRVRMACSKSRGFDMDLHLVWWVKGSAACKCALDFLDGGGTFVGFVGTPPPHLKCRGINAGGIHKHLNILSY